MTTTAAAAWTSARRDSGRSTRCKAKATNANEKEVIVITKTSKCLKEPQLRKETKMPARQGDAIRGAQVRSVFIISNHTNSN